MLPQKIHCCIFFLQIKTEHAESHQHSLLGLQAAGHDLKPATPILPSNSALLNPLHHQPQQQQALPPLEGLPTLDPAALQPATMHPPGIHHTQQQGQFMLPLPLSLHHNALDATQADLSPEGGLPPLPQPPPTLQPETIKKKRGKRGAASTDSNIEKIHACTECPYTCNRADKLRVHVKGVHNNDKPFLCTYCFKGFKQRDKVGVLVHFDVLLTSF